MSALSPPPIITDTGPHGRRMDRTYRYMRHIYDATRPLFLLGRDHMLSAITPAPGRRVLEVGCGTARNLIMLARRSPHAGLVGLDASARMLATADSRIRRSGLADRITLFHALAEHASDPGVFDQAVPFDVVFFSYSLSMMPDPESALKAALRILRSGGTLHIVDFWSLDSWPEIARRAWRRWLGWFGVAFRPEVVSFLEDEQRRGAGQLRLRGIAGTYAFIAVLTKGGPAFRECAGENSPSPHAPSCRNSHSFRSSPPP